MKTSEYFFCILIFLCLMATAVVIPDTSPQPFDIHPVADRQCNSCHENAR